MSVGIFHYIFSASTMRRISFLILGCKKLFDFHILILNSCIFLLVLKTFNIKIKLYTSLLSKYFLLISWESNSFYFFSEKIRLIKFLLVNSWVGKIFSSVIFIILDKFTLLIWFHAYQKKIIKINTIISKC